MRHALGILEDEMWRRAPAVALALRPGLSEARMQETHRISARGARASPPALSLARRCGRGAQGHAYLFPAAQWLPLEEAVKIWAGAQEGDRLGGQSV